jgi:DNA modification methylase
MTNLNAITRKEPDSEIISGTSIFDPVLCELAYCWFCPPEGNVLDPFAGGSVRGIVAAYLGRNYTGIDLRPEQVAANNEQATRIVPNRHPRWIVGDSRKLTEIAPGEYDFVFSCPPYFDLEIYGDDERDLSNTGDYQKFLADYRNIIGQSISMLKDDRFACFVVGDIRDKKGLYRNFVSDTIAAFQSAGAIRIGAQARQDPPKRAGFYQGRFSKGHGQYRTGIYS